MTNEELGEVRRLRKLFDEEFKRRQSVLSAISSINAKLDDLPKAQSLTSRTENFALLLVETENNLQAIGNELLRATAALCGKLLWADLSTDQREVLNLRYVQCLSFKDISRQMNYSIQHIFRLHRIAIRKLYA